MVNNQFSENAPSSSGEQGVQFDLKGYLFRYLKYWYLFPVFLGLAMLCAFFYLRTTQPIYQAKAKILIKDKKRGLGAQSEILQDLGQFGGNNLVENEIEVLRSFSIMEKVAADLELDINYASEDGLRTATLYKKSPVLIVADTLYEEAYLTPLIVHVVDSLHYRIGDYQTIRKFGQKLKTPWGVLSAHRGYESEYSHIIITFSKIRSVAASLIGRLDVRQPNYYTTVLDLTFEDQSTSRARDVLNKLLEVYIQSSLNDKNLEASNTLKFIDSRLGLVTSDLVDVERGVETFKRSQGLTDISLESKLFLDNIQNNDEKLNQISIQIGVLESVESYVRNATGSVVAPATYMINEPILVSLLNKFSDLNLQKEKVAGTAQPNNPIIVTLETQIANTRAAILDNVQNLSSGLKLTQQSLERISSQAYKGLRNIPQKEREFVDIKRQQSIKEGLYLYLLQKREETALSFAATVTDSRVIDLPFASSLPVKPRRMSIILAAIVLGFIFPIFIINVLLLLNDTVQRKEEIEQMAGAPVIGEIGIMKSGKKGEEPIIQMTSRSAVAEQFRALRTNLQFLGSGNCRVFMLTSSVSGEGKSFASINLAASLAFTGKKVILLGMDLRKPTLHTRLELPNTLGASNYLIGENDLDRLIKKTNVHPMLDVILSGPLPPNPSELLGNGRFSELIKELRTRYDYVMVDAPPYGLVTDAMIIGDHVEASLYLVRHNYTFKGQLKRIRDLYINRRFPNLSVVFNGVKYGGGAGYGYGYGYGYYSDSNEVGKGKVAKIMDMIGLRKG